MLERCLGLMVDAWKLPRKMEKAQTGLQKTWVFGPGFIPRGLCGCGQLSSPTWPRKIMCHCWVILKVPLSSWTPWHRQIWPEELVSFHLASTSHHPPSTCWRSGLQRVTYCGPSIEAQPERGILLPYMLLFILDVFQRAERGGGEGREEEGLLSGSITSIIVPLRM